MDLSRTITNNCPHVYFPTKEDELKAKDPNEELLEKLKFANSKKRKEAYTRLEKIIYSFKTKEDVLNFMLPYIEEGYSGVVIYNEPFTAELSKLESYIINLTDGDFKITSNSDEIGLSLKVNNIKLCGCLFPEHYECYTSKNINQNDIDILKNNISELHKKIDVLDITMREVYNAPGMPGFEQTNKHYMQHIRRKSL